MFHITCYTHFFICTLVSTRNGTMLLRILRILDKHILQKILPLKKKRINQVYDAATALY